MYPLLTIRFISDLRACAARERAEFTQRELAARLKRPHFYGGMQAGGAAKPCNVIRDADRQMEDH